MTSKPLLIPQGENEGLLCYVPEGYELITFGGQFSAGRWDWRKWALVLRAPDGCMITYRCRKLEQK